MARSRHESFDYVVIGAGSAGCVVAARVAAQTGASVVLCEAGGAYRRELDIPLLSLWAWLRRPQRYCWNDLTIPQDALEDRRLSWPAGRLVGGSSAINAMIYCRGHPASYDRWLDAEKAPEGVPQWTYSALLPYFQRAEDFEGGPSEFHGAGGPIGVSPTRYRHALTEAFLAGCREIGIPPTSDFNGNRPEGAGHFQLTQREGMRASAARYLKVLADTHRLVLRLRTTARRIVFDKHRAVGVECMSKSRLEHLRARCEVILCAGTVRSPQLLMLSGIGEPALLYKLGIPVIADLPGVGTNLQDHLRVPVAHVYHRARPTRATGVLTAIGRYVSSRSGMFTSNVADAAAILRTHAAAGVPNVRIVCRWRTLPRHPDHIIDFEVVAIDPASRGRVTPVTPNFTDAPDVDPGYLTREIDRTTLTEGIAIARSIARTAACRSAGIGEEILPGKESPLAHIRRYAESAYHAVGTCRLGTDALAVVDPWLRVRGVERLRVVDASVMPTTVAGNAQAAVFAIGERAAEWIARSA